MQTSSLTAPDGGTLGFFGGLYDGRYVYLAPGPFKTWIARYEPKAFAGASWQTFDTSRIPTNFNAVVGRGTAFDGRYLYLVPRDKTFARYDTLSAFDSVDSWQSTAPFDVQPDTLFGTGFDGRYVYYVSAAKLIRFDTHGCFDTPNSTAWQALDVSTIHELVNAPLGGSVFDGRFLYFIGDVVMRFETKSPPSMPKGFSGSFY